MSEVSGYLSSPIIMASNDDIKYLLYSISLRPIKSYFIIINE